MAREIDAMVAYVKASPATDPREPVLVAGDPERQRAASGAAEGLDVDATTWDEIEQAAASVGLSPNSTRRLSQGR